MTTQTSPSGARSVQPQGSYHWIMTVELPGRMAKTLYGTWSPPAGASRHDVFMAIKQEMAADDPELGRANVMFFALEPNQL
ncbi:hypothetical protein SMD11_3095 [Streptomyces albireticuli]|uniref:Uncharacterized protein n=1 Tax=Streptomyces albireticuli TaxID=1940 RepID=A0A1Z2L358_9ACTN|nr:hypothetical protein [Streptomyces albireticuli]ARZ68739.1 hypothetical protein SMD11_3095 [Streptomyces albireticuli]